MKAGAKHLLGIIGQILAFSRVEAGREPVHLEEVDPTAIARDAVALVDPQAGERSS
jgi:signal transduction histidine kinase